MDPQEAFIGRIPSEATIEIQLRSDLLDRQVLKRFHALNLEHLASGRHFAAAPINQ
jgi:hypothetical protein